MRAPDTPPPRGVIAVTLLAIAALPVAGALGLTGVGSFRMFAEPEHYNVRVGAVTPQGLRFIPAQQLRPHLSRDAARVLLGRGAAGGLGETHVELVEGGLDDLAVLACALVPDASSAVVVLERRSAIRQEEPSVRHERRADCERER